MLIVCVLNCVTRLPRYRVFFLLPTNANTLLDLLAVMFSASGEPLRPSAADEGRVARTSADGNSTSEDVLTVLLILFDALVVVGSMVAVVALFVLVPKHNVNVLEQPSGAAAAVRALPSGTAPRRRPRLSLGDAYTRQRLGAHVVATRVTADAAAHLDAHNQRTARMQNMAKVRLEARLSTRRQTLVQAEQKQEGKEGEDEKEGGSSKPIVSREKKAENTSAGPSATSAAVATAGTPATHTYPATGTEIRKQKKKVDKSKKKKKKTTKKRMKSSTTAVVPATATGALTAESIAPTVQRLLRQAKVGKKLAKMPAGQVCRPNPSKPSSRDCRSPRASSRRSSRTLREQRANPSQRTRLWRGSMRVTSQPVIPTKFKLLKYPPRLHFLRQLVDGPHFRPF